MSQIKRRRLGYLEKFCSQTYKKLGHKTYNSYKIKDSVEYLPSNVPKLVKEFNISVWMAIFYPYLPGGKNLYPPARYGRKQISFRSFPKVELQGYRVRNRPFWGLIFVLFIHKGIIFLYGRVGLKWKFPTSGVGLKPLSIGRKFPFPLHYEFFTLKKPWRIFYSRMDIFNPVWIFSIPYGLAVWYRLARLIID